LPDRSSPDPIEEGGDPACWVNLVCPVCGAVETDGHRPRCELARAGTIDPG
jgi:hypothetical protein